MPSPRVAATGSFWTEPTLTTSANTGRPSRLARAQRALPLAELGWDRSSARHAAQALDLPIWDAPAAPCLSSRVAYGLEITSERLRQVEQGEDFLRQLGVSGDLRVRHHGSKARLEVGPDQMARLRENWSAIDQAFTRLGFESVELDPRGYRRGALLAIAPALRV